VKVSDGRRLDFQLKATKRRRVTVARLLPGAGLSASVVSEAGSQGLKSPAVKATVRAHRVRAPRPARHAHKLKHMVGTLEG